MIKVSEKYIVEMDRKTAEAVKNILGSISDNNKIKRGLDTNQIESVRELFNVLPDPD